MASPRTHQSRPRAVRAAVSAAAVATAALTVAASTTTAAHADAVSSAGVVNPNGVVNSNDVVNSNGVVNSNSVKQASAKTAAAAISGWTQVTHYLESTLSAGEGVATVYPPGGSGSVIYRGVASIPIADAVAGWTHIGDPDSVDGYVFDAFQSGDSSPTTKMFRVTTPSGSAYEYTHALVPGEQYNNSFDAISPDTRWMVAGAWGTMSHLQVYPTPILNPQTGASGGALALSGYVQLDRQVADVQGCDFVTAAKLVCASDDNSRTLFPEQKPLLEVDLSHALAGGDVTGHVVDLGAIPQTDSICSGTFESEGVDYDPATGILRVEIIQPSICEVATTVYEYKAG